MNENEIKDAAAIPPATPSAFSADATGTAVPGTPSAVPATGTSAPAEPQGPTERYGFAPLSAAEVRVVACIVEKKITTPEYFPLTANAIVAACNQKSNRYPVVEYDERVVLAALETLRKKHLACFVSPMGARSAKYDHRLAEQLNISKPHEMAVLCELLLRGPQTVGELRNRAERMSVFESLDAVQATIDDLCARAAPFVMKLSRVPGQKECRYTHLLSGMPDLAETASNDDNASSISPVEIISTADRDRIGALAAEVDALKTQLADLRAAFEQFKAQFL